MSASFRELIFVCKSLGLECKETQSCRIYTGMANNKFCRVVLHLHAEGRDIPTGLLKRYISELGFASEQEFKEYLRTH